MSTSVARRTKRLRSPEPALFSDEERQQILSAIAAGRRVILVIANRKGGQGKTTSARTISEAAAIPPPVGLGLRTLAIDLDSQCSLSKLYLQMEIPEAKKDEIPLTRPPRHPLFDQDTDGENWDGRSSSADIFLSDGVTPYPVTTVKDVGSLDVLPGDAAKLIEVEEHDREFLLERVQNRMRDFVNHTDVASIYPLVVVDTAPSDHPLTRAALRAATHLLIPLQMEQQSIDGLNEMLSMWRRENAARTEHDMLKIVGLVPNLVSRGALHDSFYKQLKKNPGFAPHLAPFKLKRRTGVGERDVRGIKPTSIFHLTPKDESRQMMVKLVRYALLTAFGVRLKPEDFDDVPDDQEREYGN